MAEPPTVSFRIVDQNPGHTTLAVYIGRNPDSRGHSGRLVLRTDELAELADIGDQIILTLTGPVKKAVTYDD